MSAPTDFYIREEENDLINYNCDQTIIIQEKYLRYLSNVQYKEKCLDNFQKSIDWWPNCNSYYPYLEDTDALNRKEPLQISYKSDSNISSESETWNIYDEDDLYNERDAQNKYLSTTPLSFVILGKPGLGEQELGKLLADYWGSVYIDPQTLIDEEIDSGSRAGQCIEFNLRCGRAISADVIMKLVEKRVKSKSAKHRGFVLCGFPLITNDLYEEDPVSSESAIFNVQEIFDDFIDHVIPEGRTTSAIHLTENNSIRDEFENVEGEEMIFKENKPIEPVKTIEIPLDLGSANFTIEAVPDRYRNVDEQINDLFALIPEPFLLIYIVCENAEVVNKRCNYRYDVLQNKIVDLQKEEIDRKIYSIYSNNPTETSELPEGFVYLTKYDRIGTDYSKRYDLVKLPHNFESSIKTQLKKYRYEALPTIEKYALMHDPQYVIRVDGRVSPCRMFYTVKLRLDTLPFQKPVVPQQLIQPREASPGRGEDVIVETFNFDGISLQDCFEVYSRKNIASPMFKWTLSDWGTKCPVYMRDCVYIDGDPKQMVQFMDKVYFLADEWAFLNFYRNPRLYLLPPFPKLSSKIYVMGPKLVATQAVSKCLGYLLDVKVLLMDELTKQFLKWKEEELIESERSRVLAEFISKLNEERLNKYERAEKKRKEKLEQWQERVTQLLQSYCEKVSFISSKDSLNVENDDEDMKQLTTIGSYDSTFDQMLLADIEEELKLFNINCACIGKDLLEKPDLILNYAPDDLLQLNSYKVVDEKDQEVLKHVDEVIALLKVELTFDDLIEIYMTAIKDIEENDKTAGWIICGMPPNPKLLKSIQTNYPDEVFILNDNSPDHDFLVDRLNLKSLVEFSDFRKLFLDMGKRDVAARCPDASVTLFKDIIKDILQPIFEYTSDDSDDLTEEEFFKYHPRRSVIDTYRDQLYDFDAKIICCKELFESNGVSCNELDVAYKPIRTILLDVVNIVDNKFRQRAKVFTDEDREEELKDYGEPILTAEDDEVDEEDEHEMKIGTVMDSFMKNRRYGDTLYYCPVAFKERFVLWRGKDEFGAKFENKIYFMHSEDAMERFIADPKAFLFKKGPPEILPPPRICITGLPGSGKTTLANRLARNLGIYYGNFLDLIRKVNVAEMNDYISNGDPLSEETLNKVLFPYWFHEPRRSLGFVLDGFPRRACDVDYMIENLTIPDIIIDLTALSVILAERLTNVMLDKWKKKTHEEKANKNKINQQLLKDWKENTDIQMKEVLDEVRQMRYEKERLEKEESEENYEIELDVVQLSSQISYDSIADEQDVKEAKRIVETRLPPPTLLDSWPTEEEMLLKINEEIEANYNLELQLFTGIKDICNSQLIPWTSIEANLDREKTFAQVMKLVDGFKYRSESLFERCYDISTELAETLLNFGYYFLSKFGRTCPVQYHDKFHTFQLYLSLGEKFQIYPVIYRYYIYFLGGKKNRDKFYENPFKYIITDKFQFPLIPFRIAIIGPPKCGKTTLAQRFKRELGLKHISIGKAVRYVLNFLPYTELAKNMEIVLRKGWQLTPEMEIKCVEAMSLEASAVALGCVFDGFPNDKEEVRQMAQLGILPHLVINLITCKSLIYDFLKSSETGKDSPKFSEKFIDYRHKVWLETQSQYRHWLDKEYQIIANLPVRPCKWGVWSSAYELATACLFEIRFYHIHSSDETALRLSYMQVSPMEYIHRRSSYKEYCVCCLYYNALTRSQNPPDRTGLIQYKYYFYWLCSEHVEEFILDPGKYLSPYNPNKLPQNLPETLNLKEQTDFSFYEKGYCMICYVDNLPNVVFNHGLLEHAVEYRNNTYLFDVGKCRDKFMKYPEKYYNTKINFKGGPLTEINIKELPILGYLEQYVAQDVIKALINTVNKRPIIYGLGIDVSAALNVGLYLKVNNPNTKEEVLTIFKNAFNLFNKRHLLLIKHLHEKKEYLNPYLYYEEPLKPLILPSYPPYKKPSIMAFISIIDDILNTIVY